MTALPRAVLLVLVLSLVGGTPIVASPATRVDPDLEAALATHDRLHVIVALRRPSGALTFTSLVSTAVRTREQLLSRVPPSAGFRPTAQWDAVFAVAGEATRRGVQRLQVDPDVLRLGLDRGGRGAGDRDLALIRADVVQSAGVTGKGVNVAVLDSGVDEAHPDLAGSLVTEHCFAPPSGCPNGTAEQDGSGSARDDHGHGTNVAGIVTSDGHAAPIGVAPASGLVAVRVLDAQNRFQSTSQIVSALNWIATTRPDVRVINISLGTDKRYFGRCDDTDAGTLALASAVNVLRTRGTLSFAASLNSGWADSMTAPACLSDVVSVGAVYSSDVGPSSVLGCHDATTAPDRVACFSNSSSQLDLLGPGVAVASTGRGGGTSVFTGTSQASPFAAGAAALLLEVSPTLPPSALEALLESTGKPVADPRNGLIRPRIDVATALDTLRGPVAAARVSPTVLAFGRVPVGRRRTLRVAVRDVGRATLAVTVGVPPRGFSVRPGQADIAVGTATTFVVTFRPTAARRFRGAVALTTNDPQAARVFIALRGTGVRR